MGASITYTPDDPQPRQKCGFEWRTSSTLLGLPLIHIALGRNNKGKILVAKGIIAIGQYGYGGLVVAQFGAGIICITQFGVGLIALSQFAIAAAAIAQMGVAAFGIFQMGICLDGIGQHLLSLKN
jgi:uncharacterized membrane protein YciS (DUF1049 family)